MILYIPYYLVTMDSEGTCGCIGEIDYLLRYANDLLNQIITPYLAKSSDGFVMYCESQHLKKQRQKKYDERIKQIAKDVRCKKHRQLLFKLFSLSDGGSGFFARNWENTQLKSSL